MKQFAIRLILVGVCLAGTAAHALAEKRVALVIGNAAYKHVTPLKNPKNDAEAITAALTRLDFQVVTAVDVDRLAFERKVRDFARAIRGSDVALLFYAGHGLQVHGRNYLAPIDARLKDEADLDFETLALSTIMKQMERESRTNLVFLDACRDNPLATNLARSMGTRSAKVGRGLARIESGVGTLIAFATQPGNVALDGAGRNSPFTEALLKHIETPGLDVAVMMRRVRQKVFSQTNGSQVPWSTSSLTGEFTFAAHKTPVVSNDTGAKVEFDASANELAFWNSVSASQDPKAFELFLKKFPNSEFATLARLNIDRLKQARERKSPDQDTELELAYWRSIQDSKDPAQFQSYLKRFPKGIFVDLAMLRLDGLRVKQEKPKPLSTLDLPTVAAADIVKSVKPATVVIKVQRSGEGAKSFARNRRSQLPSLPKDHPLREFFDQLDKSQSEKPEKSDADTTSKRRLSASNGSGFLVSADGYVVTSHAVIANADTIDVHLDNGEQKRARLIGSDRQTDLALLKIEPGSEDYPWVSFAERSAYLDETLLALGNPFGLGTSVAAGRVVGWEAVSGGFDHVEVDGSINKGDSGGPLVDGSGSVLGVVVTYKLDGSNKTHRGYAVPANIAAEVINQLKRTGEVSDRTALERQQNRVRRISAAPAARLLAESDRSADLGRKLQAAVGVVQLDGKKNAGIGFFISGEGHFVTANHVVTDARSFALIDQEGKKREAKLIGRDPRSDLALLKAKDAGTTPYLPFETRQSRLGDHVISFSRSPGPKVSVISGILSGRDRDTGVGPYGFVQSDLRIEIGDSGAPLLNMRGEIVGVNMSILSPAGGSVGVSFAVPAKLARSVIDQLRSAGDVKRGWLGVKIQNVTDDIAESVGLKEARGTLISEVTVGGPAARDGRLKKGTVILSVGGQPVKDSRDLARKVAALSPNSVVEFEVLTDGKRDTVAVTLGSFPGASALKASAKTEEKTAVSSVSSPNAKSKTAVLPERGVKGERVSALKMELVSVSKYSRSARGVKDGVFVVAVDPDSPAAERGLQRGDIIVALNSEKMRWVREARDIVAKASRRGRRAVLLTIKRDDQRRFVAVPIK